METFIYEYKGYGGCESKCKLYHLIIDNIHHFCFEDINIGTSVTNMSEFLATSMIKKYNLESKDCRFYERYNNDDEPTFDTIIYSWYENKAHNPEWIASENSNLFGFL